MEDRLTHIKKKAQKARIYYSRYSPRADMMYEVEEGDDDLLWMIHEIERLRADNAELLRRLEEASG